MKSRGAKTGLCLLTALTLVSACSETELVEDAPLLDTTWNLVSLEGESVQLAEPSQVPYLHFTADEVTGYDGCNNFFGSYTLDGDRVTFDQLASTLLVCLDNDALDFRFGQVLVSTNRYRIDGSRLRLYEDEVQLASFIAAEQP